MAPRSFQNKVGESPSPRWRFEPDPIDEERERVRIEGAQPGLYDLIFYSLIAESLEYKGTQRYAIVLGLWPGGSSERKYHDERDNQDSRGYEDSPHG